MTSNVYVHIPFCKGGKCRYCSFISFPDLSLKREYINSLISQISKEYNGEELDTLYIGGGTPSLLALNELKYIIDLFKLNSKAEITIEVNPESVNFDYLKGLLKLGFNRLSIGVQTFDDKILNLIGRKHSSAQAINAITDAKNAGFKNISTDLIYGLPSQTLPGFEADLMQATVLNIQHISLYGLKIESGCYFDENCPANLPDLDLQADMYLKAVEFLKSSGFEHYEVSNFSKAGFDSTHNLNYWNNNSYYGFGCSASGYVDGFRFTNEDDLVKYISYPLEKLTEQNLSQQEVLEEAIFLGLRKIAGINICEINNKFGIDFYKKYSNVIDKYIDYFIKSNEFCALNINGILISNLILSEFID